MGNGDGWLEQAPHSGWQPGRPLVVLGARLGLAGVRQLSSSSWPSSESGSTTGGLIMSVVRPGRDVHPITVYDFTDYSDSKQLARAAGAVLEETGLAGVWRRIGNARPFAVTGGQAQWGPNCKPLCWVPPLFQSFLIIKVAS